MAISATHHLHVLSVYDYTFKAPASGLPAETTPSCVMTICAVPTI